MNEITGRIIIRFNDDGSIDQIIIFDTGEEVLQHVTAEEAGGVIKFGLRHVIAQM